MARDITANAEKLKVIETKEVDLNDITGDPKSAGTTYLLPATALTNAPAGISVSGRRFLIVNRVANYCAQMFISLADNKSYTRTSSSIGGANTWSDWDELNPSRVVSANINNKVGYTITGLAPHCLYKITGVVRGTAAHQAYSSYEVYVEGDQTYVINYIGPGDTPYAISSPGTSSNQPFLKFNITDGLQMFTSHTSGYDVIIKITEI